MWSGPRNISTAMMRAWGNRSDTQVIDEPLYGSYLYQSGKKHPMYKEIMHAQGTDATKIISHLITDKLPPGKHIYYQKHMCHHLGDDLYLDWVTQLNNIFLIRDPRYVLASYIKKHKQVTAKDLAYPQQLKLFNYIRDKCAYPPMVIETADFLSNPKAMLQTICQQLEIDFDTKMLSWPKGYRPADGIWARHWYNRVVESTGFTKHVAKEIKLNDQHQEIVDTCMVYYQQLNQYALKTPNQ